MQMEVDQMDIMDVCQDKLWDIDQIDIKLEDSMEEKALQFMSQTKGGARTHKNGDYIVRVHFSDTDYTATDAISHY
ncbi:MAG: hypothetical protein PHX08_24865, partial [Lachnospiraceae bacterium]|nr:hypothetical protein [Lachnospiraceae bacterium]